MIVLHADLDNTLIYSYKQDIGSEKKNVEMYHGRPISYATNRTLALLRELKTRILIVPTSTRTVEQYKRIELGIGEIKYALICNGGILLVDGAKDERWYQDSVRSIADSLSELDMAFGLLEREPRRCFELRFIEGLFLFTKCTEPEAVVRRLEAALDMSMVCVMSHGEKIYVVPKKLTKGSAVRRFRSYIQADYVIAAGDSAFDSSMLEEADLGFAPCGFRKKYGADAGIRETEESRIFSEAFLEELVPAFNLCRP